MKGLEKKKSRDLEQRIDAAKQFIENKYKFNQQEDKEKQKIWTLIKQRMSDYNLPLKEQNKFVKEIVHKDSEILRLKRQKLSIKDFDFIAIIGRGAFGEVQLCKSKEGEVLAIKKMKKSEMLEKFQSGHVRAERDILSKSNADWIVQLKYSFQDDEYLYLVMEYLAGGDLMTLLIKKDLLSEDEAKFYIAECILAIDAVHQLNYIHRDLKPDNILIDKFGHIKLSDFGLCKNTEVRGKKISELNDINPDKNNINFSRKFNHQRRQLAFSKVGTPDYIAPEVFYNQGYTETVDWWSLGIILFEMLVGYPPFFSEDPSETCKKILCWKEFFVIPDDAYLSLVSQDLITRLICDADERLGVNGVGEIKIHPFFKGINWKNIRQIQPPFIPELKNEIDTQHFDKFEAIKKEQSSSDTKIFSKKVVKSFKSKNTLLVTLSKKKIRAQNHCQFRH